MQSYTITQVYLPVATETPGTYLSRNSDLVILQFDLAPQIIVRYCCRLRNGGRPGLEILSSDILSVA